jgi:diadenylate cyclase
MQSNAREVTRTVLEHARQMAQECGARTIVLCADVFSSPTDLKADLAANPRTKTVIVTRDPSAFEDAASGLIQTIQVPGVDLTRTGQVKVAILLGISRGVLGPGDRLICLSGIPRSDDMDTILFTEVGEEFEMFAAADGEELGQYGNPEVFEKVLDIAVELGQEGREGKPVGAIFVIGDIEHVKQFSEPLMLNPFQGHPEAQRNVLAPSLRETIKELSALDGAFLVRNDGVVEAAGMFLRSVIPGSVLPHGLGARHRSAAGITAATKSTAITVSESTGTVTVFRDGKIIIEIEKPRPIGAMAPEPKDLVHKAAPEDTGGVRRRRRVSPKNNRRILRIEPKRIQHDEPSDT